MRGIRIFNALAGVTTLAVFLQAISAGIFMSFRGSDAGEPWVTTHDIVANVAVVLALATAIVAIVTVRRAAPALTGAAVLLVVLLVLQTLIGHWIDSAHWLVAIHVPLALLVFAVTIWLSVRGAAVRRRLATPAAAAAV